MVAFNSRSAILLGLVFLVALGIRLAGTHKFQGLSSPPDSSANPDQVDYDLYAWQLSEGRGYVKENGEPTAARAPGTSLTLLPAYLIFGHSYLAARIWLCVLSALTCVAVSAVAGRAFGAATGAVAGFGLAVYPGHFYYSMHLLSEPVFGLWLTLAMGVTLLALKSRQQPPLTITAVAGFLLGLAVLTRPQAILLLPVGFLAALLCAQRKHALRVLVIMAIACSLVVTPWVLRNHATIGKATLTTIGGYTFWGAHNHVILENSDRVGQWMPVDDLIDEAHPVEGNEVEREAATYKHGFAFVRDHWTRMPYLIAMKIYRLVTPFQATTNRPVYWCFALAWIVTAPLLIFGLKRAFSRDPLVATVLALPLLTTLATATIYYGSIRFRDSVAAVFVIPAAFGLTELWNRIRTARADQSPASPDRVSSGGSTS